MIYSVHAGMPVPALRLQITELLEQPFLVHLLVGLSWTDDCLQHTGTISDRVFPGTTTPCPYLQQGSRVLVYLKRPVEHSEIPEIVPIGMSSLDVAPAKGGWLSEPTKSALKRNAPQDIPERHTVPKSDFFDDAYVRGKHVGSRNHTDLWRSAYSHVAHIDRYRSS
jgi:hypothetical protein